MKKEVAIKVLEDIMPAGDNTIRRAMLMAVESLKSGEDHSGKHIYINVIHQFEAPTMPTMNIKMPKLSDLEKLFGGGDV